LLRGTGSLLASALILLGLYYYIEKPAPGYAPSDTKLEIPVEELRAVIGSAEFRSDGLRMIMAQRERSHVSFIATATNIPAASFPLLRYRIAGHTHGMRLTINWRTAHAPNAMNQVIERWTPGETRVVNLGKNPYWTGTITALGLKLEASEENNSAVLEEIELLPRSFAAAMENTWRAWQEFRPWDVRSLGFLLGTADINAPSPIIAAAAWAVLALILVLIWGVLAGIHYPVSHALVLIIPWLAVDLHWQHNLGLQIETSKRMYQGKTTAEKHAVSPDAHLLRYTDHLKETVLPEPPARIFILDHAQTRSYAKIKTHYFLLPHLVYSYGKVPPKESVYPGDYILSFKESEFLRFDEESGLLRWGQNSSLPVERLDDNFLASFFRVLPAELDEGASL